MGERRRSAQVLEESSEGLPALALFETIAAQLSPNPFVQALEVKPTGRIAVVEDPSNQEQVEFDNHPRQTNAPITTGDLADFLLSALDALGSDPKLTVQEEPMAEELAFPDRSDRTLETVDAQPEFLFQKPGDRFHHSLPCRQRLHVNVAIVGVATEVMTAAFQFLVEIIQQQIG